MSTQNPSASAGKNPGIGTRIISAALGGGLTYMVAPYLVGLLALGANASLVVYALAAAVALVGLIAPKWLLLPAALTVVPAYRLGKYLTGQAYNHWMRGILNFFIGVPASIGAALATATYVGWTHNLSLLIWFPAACIAFVATLFIIEPAAFLYVFKPVSDKLEKLWKWTGDVAKKYAKDTFQSIVNVVRNLPGSNRLWTWVENKEKGEQWVDGFMGFITGVGVLALTGTVAYIVFHAVAPFAAMIASGWIMTGLTGFASGVVAIAMIGILFQLLDKGEVPFVGTALTAAGVYAAHPLTAMLGLGLYVNLGICLVEFVIGLAYIYPGIHGLLKSGILDGIKKLVKLTYNEENAGYRKFFAQVVTLICSVISIGLVYLALSFYAFPLYIIIPVALVCAASTYLSMGEAFDDFPTTVFAGGTLSLGLGFAGWYFLVDSMSAFIFWPLLVLAVVFNFAVVLTLIYQGIRYVTIDISKETGEKLAGIHKSAYDKVRELTKWWNKKVIDETYELKKDEPYRNAFLHVFNATVLGLGVWQALPLTAGLWGLPAWATLSGLVVSAALIYLILGRILLTAGATAVGIAIAIGTFAHGTWTLYQLAPAQWWLAATVASAFTGAIFYVLTPAILWVVRKVFGVWLIKPIGWVLGWVFDRLWKRFEVVAEAFFSVCKFVNKWLLQPLFNLVGRFFSAIVDAWNSIFGKR